MLVNHLGQGRAAFQRRKDRLGAKRLDDHVGYYVNTIRSTIDATPALVMGGFDRYSHQSSLGILHAAAAAAMSGRAGDDAHQLIRRRVVCSAMHAHGQ